MLKTPASITASAVCLTGVHVRVQSARNRSLNGNEFKYFPADREPRALIVLLASCPVAGRCRVAGYADDFRLYAGLFYLTRRQNGPGAAPLLEDLEAAPAFAGSKCSVPGAKPKRWISR